MKSLVQFGAVAAGGALGAVARHIITVLCARWIGTSFPIGTLVINLTGSFVLGLFIAAAATRVPVSDVTRLAVVVGFLGAYTTFSTYIFDSNALLEDRAWIKASANLLGSVIVGMFAVRLGLAMGTR